MPKIIRFHETGSTDVLKIEGLPPTEPGDGEVRLKVEAISLNRAELMFRRGQLSLPFIHPEDIFKRLGERIHGGARQHA